METKSKRIGRLIKIIGNQPGITLSQLCKLVQRNGIPIGERTVAKDILSLKNDFDLLPRKARLRQGYQLSDMLTVGETEVAVVADALSAFAYNLNDDEAKSVVDRMLALIATPNGTREENRVGKRLLGQKVIVESGEDNRSLERLIMSAVRERLPLKLKYESPRTKGGIAVSGYPLFKIFYERAWYLIIRELKSGAYYPCRMDRIHEAGVIAGERNEHFLDNLADARYLMSCGWGMTFPNSKTELKKLEKQEEIVVRFDSTVAPYIMEGKRRHPFARVQRARDGTGDVIFSIKLLDNWEFKHWVRTFGSAARYVSPTKLVDEERAEIRRTAERYGLRMR